MVHSRPGLKETTLPGHLSSISCHGSILDLNGNDFGLSGNHPLSFATVGKICSARMREVLVSARPEIAKYPKHIQIRSEIVDYSHL